MWVSIITTEQHITDILTVFEDLTDRAFSFSFTYRADCYNGERFLLSFPLSSSPILTPYMAVRLFFLSDSSLRCPLFDSVSVSSTLLHLYSISSTALLGPAASFFFVILFQIFCEDKIHMEFSFQKLPAVCPSAPSSVQEITIMSVSELPNRYTAVSSFRFSRRRSSPIIQ